MSRPSNFKVSYLWQTPLLFKLRYILKTTNPRKTVIRFLWTIQLSSAPEGLTWGHHTYACPWITFLEASWSIVQPEKNMYHSHIYKEFNHTKDCPMILLFISWRARERRAASSSGDWNRESVLPWWSSCEDFICVLLFLLLLRVLVRNDTLGGIRLGWKTVCKNTQNYLQCR